MPAGKQYTVLHRFERVNPENGDVTAYEVGDTYSGADTDKYLADPNPYAPDHGPLIAEKADDAAKDARSAAAADKSDAAKEK